MLKRSSVVNLCIACFRPVSNYFGPHRPYSRRLYRRCYFAYKQFIEDGLERLLKRNPSLLQGGCVLDVGANIGYTSHVFSKFLDSTQVVHAFEPELANFQMLCELVSEKDLQNKVVPHHLAVGDRSGQAEVEVRRSHPADHRIVTEATQSTGSQVVTMVSLDDFLEQAEGISSVSFVKVDVQGFELSVCKGMTRTLIQNPDVILMIELSRNDLRYFGVEAQDMLEYLRSRFSHVYGIRRSGTLMSVTFETLERSLVDERTPAYTDILLANRPLQ